MSFLRNLTGCFVFYLAVGCGSKSGGPVSSFDLDAAIADGGTTAEAGALCDSDEDCAGRNLYCAFDMAGGCAAQGSCRVHEATGVCSPTDFVTVCTCSGATIEYCREPAPMYTNVRVAHEGPCGDAGKDAATD